MFASRVFRHSFIFVNKKHIKSPKDLEGKRIGVPVYTMTAAIFIRGLLSDEHGIDFSKCEWVEGDINSAKPHGNPTILPTAKKLSIGANKSGKSLSQMLEDGELQAIIGTGTPEAFGRNPDIVRLYPDYRAAEMDYYKRTKIFPIMHTVVIRRDVHEQASVRRDRAVSRLRPVQEPRAEEDELPRHAALHAAVDDRRARRYRRGVRRRSLALRRRSRTGRR